jgi:hypothetical protein
MKTDYDVLADGVVVGRIFKANAVPVGNAVDVDAGPLDIIRTARPRTATQQRARPLWRLSRRAGGANKPFTGGFH